MHNSMKLETVYIMHGLYTIDSSASSQTSTEKEI